MNPFIAACITVAAVTLAACGRPETATSTTTPTETPAKIGMANPASMHCVALGGKLEIRTDKDGGQYGMCALPDGRICEEWALFRDKQCKAAAEN